MGGRARGRAFEVWDRIIASDPGLIRLGSAAFVAVAMAGAMAIEYAVARQTGAGAQDTLIFMMLGTVAALMGSNAFAGDTAVLGKVWTAVGFPVSIGSGLFVGALVGSHTDLMLAVFVAVMFTAVYIRRFGMAFFFYGFMVWMGYFFAAFLHPQMRQLPAVLGAVTISAAWVLLLSLTVMRPNTRRTLRRVRRAFGARARAVARSCADLLAAEDPQRRERMRRRLHARQLRLAETALMIEGWSAERGALPEGWSGAALRRHLLDAQLAMDALATAADTLATADGPMRDAAFRIADALAGRDDARVERASWPLLDPPGQGEPAAGARTPAPGSDPAAHVPSWARRDTDASAGRESGDAPGHGRHRRSDPGGGAAATRRPGAGRHRRDAAGASEGGPWAARHLAAAAIEYIELARIVSAPSRPSEQELTFESAVTLALGNLPGSAAVAGGVQARGRHWNPLARMRFTTRQAVQVAVAGALAILVGREISETRYYWAVIATFVAFTGTATRSETAIKAGNRVAGTLVGLAAGIGLAHLTAGHTLAVLAVIIGAMACGFYMVQISYAIMIFFITIMVSQLYSVLHEFSAGLLVLRLEETSAGAAVGILVGLFVLPTSTRDTANTARASFYTAVAELLHRFADRLDGRDPSAGVAALSLAVDRQVHALALVARPLTRTLVVAANPRAVRHRLVLSAAVARRSRTLAAASDRPPADPVQTARLAGAARSLADAASGLAARPELPPPTRSEIEGHLADAEAALLSSRPECAAATPPMSLALVQLSQLLHELASLPGATAPGPSARGASRSRIVAGSADTVPRPRAGEDHGGHGHRDDRDEGGPYDGTPSGPLVQR